MSFAGKNLLLKIESDSTPGTYLTVGGMRSNSFNINDETVDVSSKDGNGFRELMEGAGLRTVSLSGSGVFKDDAMTKQINSKILAGTHSNWQVIVPGLGTYQGKFAATSFDISGEYNGEITFNLSLDSAGDITFTAE